MNDTKEAFLALKKANSIVLATHVNPDGDTISSALALYVVLKKMGKKVYLFNEAKELPVKYDFLPFYKKFSSNLPKKFDLLVGLDSSNIERLGLKVTVDKNFIINIDHHKSNVYFGRYNIVNPNRASTSLVLYDFLVENEQKITKDVAVCLYTGLVCDTNFFMYRGVDEYVFSVASKLIKTGFDQEMVTRNLRERNSLAKLRLTQLFLESIELKKNATVGVGIVTQKDFEKSGASVYDSEDLVNIIISLATVKLAVFLRELENGKYKFSLRSKGEIDVSKIAVKYGGGGHFNAAGFSGEFDLLENILQEIEIKDV